MNLALVVAVLDDYTAETLVNWLEEVITPV